ncbi:Beta-1,3-xylanase XYL4 [Dirofilaria immitis]
MSHALCWKWLRNWWMRSERIDWVGLRNIASEGHRGQHLRQPATTICTIFGRVTVANIMKQTIPNISET